MQGIMERSCRMKRIVMGVVTLAMACAMAVGQASLLNEATNGLFKNVNDYVIKPNVKFNTVETKQVIIGGGFDNLGFESNATGGGLIGYFHPGTLPWSVAGSLNLSSGDSNHTVTTETVNNNGDVLTSAKYKNPAFANYKGGMRFTIGVPDTMNLSAGVVAFFAGNGINGSEYTSTVNGVENTAITTGTKTFHMTLGFPVGLEFTSEIYNYFEPFIFLDKETKITGTTPDDKQEETTSKTKFMIYDKLTIQNLLPNPFGQETGFWIGIGNTSPHLTSEDIVKNISELEPQAYNTSSINYDVKFVTQLGAYNMLDFSAAGIELKFKPMIYFDVLLGSHKSGTFGTTLAAEAGIYAPLGNLPLAVFFGATPALRFYTTTGILKDTRQNQTTTRKTTSRAFTTNLYWSGKVGTSVLLPKDMTLDLTLNMDSENKSLGLSAQMSIAL